MDIQRKTIKASVKNVLSGAINVAIEKAERYGTPLVVKSNGKIEELTPKQMRKRIKT